MTLAARIERATERSGAITFIGSGAPEQVEWARLHEEAQGVAAALQSQGVGPGNRVVLLGTTTRPFVTAIEATWLAGAATVVLPLPMRLGSIDEFVAQTRARVRSSAATLLLVDPDFAPFVDRKPGDPPMEMVTDLKGSAADFERPPDDQEALAVLQFTSGSTADPKGVMLPNRCIDANHAAMTEAAQLDVEDDVVVSWLPLYHDMGLIGLLGAPMSTGVDLVLAAPQDFLAAPGRWMEWMSEFGGTVTAGPNFSYALAARALRRHPGLDLSRWRLGLNGAEPVDPDAVDDFCAAAERHGLDRRAVFPAFGMAEATLAVTFPEPFSGMAVDVVDRRVLETDRYAAVAKAGAEGSRRLARLGRPVPGLDIRIVDPETGSHMRDREVGELEISGTSVTPGYFRHPDATEAAFHDGWLRTGDLAYLVDGELVVCGRLKDVIIVGGRNVFPEDVERAVSGIEGIRAGNVIAFGVEGRRGRESLVVVAESRSEDPGQVRRLVGNRVRAAVGLSAGDVVLVQPGTLPKTSSGKLQRSLCRARYLDAALQIL